MTLHIETCPHCQRRLQELAADDDSWSDAAVALGEITESSVVIAIDAELSSDMPMQADSVSLDFLEPPSHPEMLGRIGRYEVERLIGMGGMGIVLKAFDTELHRPVAIKVLAPHLAHSGAARQRFAREAQSAAAVVHENVVPIHNVDVAGKLPFLVMQYVAGESLQARVDRTGPLSVDEVLRIGAQIANGLSAAHDQGLVHRDVKPGNVLLEESVDRVLISDFGLARAADDASVTRSGVIAGTPHYMSPEQARGNAVDARSDLFGLGSVLYFMCTGRPPFRADGAIATLNRICHDPHRPVDEVNSQIPAGLAELIDCLLSKQPGKRPASAAEVCSLLTRELQDKRRRHRFRSRSRSRNKAIAVFVAALAGCVVLSLLAWTLNQQGNKSASTQPTPAKTGHLDDTGQTTERNGASHRQAHVGHLSETLPNDAAPPSGLDVPRNRQTTAELFPETPAANAVPLRRASDDFQINAQDPFYETAYFREIEELNGVAEALSNEQLSSLNSTGDIDYWRSDFNVAVAITEAIELGSVEFTVETHHDATNPEQPQLDFPNEVRK